MTDIGTNFLLSSYRIATKALHEIAGLYASDCDTAPTLARRAIDEISKSHKEAVADLNRAMDAFITKAVKP